MNEMIANLWNNLPEIIPEYTSDNPRLSNSAMFGAAIGGTTGAVIGLAIAPCVECTELCMTILLECANKNHNYKPGMASFRCLILTTAGGSLIGGVIGAISQLYEL